MNQDDLNYSLLYACYDCHLDIVQYLVIDMDISGL